MANHSPLRYPGGKGKLANYMSSILELNGLEGGHYAEPFAGGAAVALDLLFSERVKHIHINDLDWSVYAFWKAVVEYNDEFVEKILATDVSLETWRNARDIKRSASEYSVIEAGFATFFLNRTNRSGILNGGVIGGLAQEGDWKIDCRFNKAELVERIKRIGIFASRISVTNEDASEFLDCLGKTADRKCLVYIDPPYYVKGAYLYQNHFDHEDHVSLAKVVQKITGPSWLVSYDNVEQIRRIYKDNEQEQFSIGYSARNYGKGSEVMIFGPNLRRPGRVYTSKADYRAYLKSA